MTIDEIIETCYWDNKRARTPDCKGSIAPPPDKEWSTSEVYSLILEIKKRCNAELARKFLDD